LAFDGLCQEIKRMVPLVRQVMKQSHARIFRCDTRSEGKIVSVFEPSTEIIRKGKTSKPTEFGKMCAASNRGLRPPPTLRRVSS